MHDLIPFPTQAEWSAMPAAIALATGAGASLATSDELQSLIVAIITLAVREFFYWLRNRRRTPPPTDPPGGMG